MNLSRVSVIDAGSCDECGAGGRTGTETDASRSQVMITTIECGRSTLKLCDHCKSNLSAKLRSVSSLSVESPLLNPPHPGPLLKENVITALGLSVTETADRLDITRVALSRVVNGRAAISTDLALRLEEAGVSTAHAWLTMQLNYDLARAKQHHQPPIRSLQTEVAKHND
ncbi:HigA family addiction module antitoxin [uncultured Amphritea sp.]|uniref:HigA family addiction module antitoxin n=1 Tax=uncultured Amphritea sp. TaxID=981605 RepID=UPI0026145393|nr:HigA family addiction module antitoxin [uncultured Amphritea sp.]